MSQPPGSPYANPDVVSRVRALWPTHSASQIAVALWQEFQIQVSRNSVVGKLHRDKITCAHKITVHPLTTRQHSPRLPRTHRRHPPREPIEVTALRCAEIVPLGLTLMELEPGECRYPYGDGPFTFCGHKAVEGFSWCGPHKNLCTGIGTYAERAAQTVVL